MNFSDKAIKYFTKLKTTDNINTGIDIINPYESNAVKRVVKEFFNKFYNDNNKRIFIIGINPGRFGGGVTGISFTDPIALKEHCGINNNLGNIKELSSKFIYQMITAYGGTDKFYSKVFITALYPLALIKDGKNFNYYDDKSVAVILRNEIIKNLKTQISFGANNEMAIILGKKNADYFLSINKEFDFFRRIVVLEHPRYIMQYKSKQINAYIEKYLELIS